MPTTAINAIQLSQLFATRTGISYSDDNIRNKLIRRTSRICPVPPLTDDLPRKNGLVWPLDRYLEIEGFLLARDVSTLPPLTRTDELFIEGLGLLSDAAADIRAAAAITDDIRNSLPQPA